ncbi:Tubulin-specific chaperone E-like Protein [Tribolium castaneum]|uniref:Tubulin-specific chaperone E n=1 Tax=Tribolium castaneum TaxID=7070 RepID=D6WI91_TRICA|nr:PREDICTED: tubulin-specific chaperone E [Tribolium castaneum]EFA01432.2 Tubulin-specific chaperone E-like Protein [Tribolium castaneum]|eukprot:XP_970901.1 PREDICTED: tubulin-specific chaperone E [Tribolium castaneum]
MTNSHSPCQIGDRIESGGYIGTVKYVGPIEGKPSIWLGIDWDNPQRGKHDGRVNGVQYFTTRNPTSGSFIRPEKVNCGKSALASIESRYGQIEDEFTAKINKQKQLLIQQNMNAPFLEMVGFDKVFHKQSDFTALRIVNLRDQGINSAGPPLRLGETCPNIEELDISKNLLVSWESVFEICRQLPRLFWLNVSENLLDLPTISESFPNVTTLICGCMDLDWGHICQLGRIFPSVEEFRAPNNKIRGLSTPEGFFTKLKLLDLEGNNIEFWTEVCKLGDLPHLEQLILEDIGLQLIEFEGDSPKVQVFRAMKKLCVVKNLIREWRSVAELNRLESLENLRFSKNPITESEEPDTIHQIIIAKIANLKILNGVEIEATERRGAEYDYMKKYGLEWLEAKGTNKEADFLKTHNRYLELIQKYGELEESELVSKPKIIKNTLVQLSIIFEDFTIEKKVPLTMTVQKLIVLTQKLFSLSGRPHLIYASKSDPEIEILLEDEMKEIGVYSMQNGDKIIVKDKV